MHDMLNLEADGPQQQKTTPGATSVRYEQDTEATIWMASPKLGQKTEHVAWSDESAVTFRWWDQNLAKTEWKPCIILPSSLTSTVLAAGAVIVRRIFSCLTLDPLILSGISTNSLPEYCSWTFMTTGVHCSCIWRLAIVVVFLFCFFKCHYFMFFDQKQKNNIIKRITRYILR